MCCEKFCWKWWCGSARSVGVAVGGGVYVRNVRRSKERCEINEIKIAVGYENKYIHILEEILCSRFIFLPPLCSSLHHSFASSSSFSSSSHAAVPMPPTSYDDVRYTREIIWLLRQDSTEHSTSHRCTTATNDARWSAWIQQQWIADLNIRLSLAHADGWSWCSSYSFFFFSKKNRANHPSYTHCYGPSITALPWEDVESNHVRGTLHCAAI